MEREKERFARLGLGVAAISYDSPEVLRHAAERLGITIPLLSDEGSFIIRAFGILNTNVPEGDRSYGIPFPGTYVVDENGKVVGKYFEQYHRQRYTTNTILAKEYGVRSGRRLHVRTDHLDLTAWTTEDAARRGNRIMLAISVKPRPKMHVYAPGVEAYRPATFSVRENNHLLVHDAVYSAPEILHLPAIKETVPVYQKTFTITRDITISPKFREPLLEIPAVFDYQACDDRVCYRPTQVSLSFKIRLQEHDGQRVPEQMRKQGSSQ